MTLRDIVNVIHKKKGTFLENDIVEAQEINTLFVDEMWNKIFTEDMKDDNIKQAEAELKEILIREQELKIALKRLPMEKKKYMTQIINLTPDKFNKNDNKANNDMIECKEKIKEINEQIEDLKRELRVEVMPKKEIANDKLLEASVKLAYDIINKNREMAQQTSKKIEDMKQQLNILITEKNNQEEKADSLYQYIHDLLGGEKIEQLDKKYLKGDWRVRE